MEEANRAVIEERERNERQNQQLSDYEAEINLMRRRVETLESDREKDRKQIAHLQDALNRARMVHASTLILLCELKTIKIKDWYLVTALYQLICSHASFTIINTMLAMTIATSAPR